MVTYQSIIFNMKTRAGSLAALLFSHSVCLSGTLSIFLSVNLSVTLCKTFVLITKLKSRSVFLSVFLSVYKSVCQSDCLVCRHVFLFRLGHVVGSYLYVVRTGLDTSLDSSTGVSQWHRWHRWQLITTAEIGQSLAAKSRWLTTSFLPKQRSSR